MSLEATFHEPETMPATPDGSVRGRECEDFRKFTEMGRGTY
jgi:hypothetical protein